jgi:hypothetical protein
LLAIRIKRWMYCAECWQRFPANSAIAQEKRKEPRQRKRREERSVKIEIKERRAAFCDNFAMDSCVLFDDATTR